MNNTIHNKKKQIKKIKIGDNQMHDALSRIFGIGLNTEESDYKKQLKNRLSNVEEIAIAVAVISGGIFIGAGIIVLVSGTVMEFHADLTYYDLLEKTGGQISVIELNRIVNETIMNSTTFDVVIVSSIILGGSVVVGGTSIAIASYA
jgi:fumarate hydratase class II